MSNDAPTRPFTSIAQAAYRIGVPEKWLKTEADAGRVPSLLVGKHRMVNIERVLEVLMDRANGVQELNLVLKQRQRQGYINLDDNQNPCSATAPEDEPGIIRISGKNEGMISSYNGGGTAAIPHDYRLG